MDLINKTVDHKKFGFGKICDLSGHVISVRFGKEVRRFIFPDAFREFLFLRDKRSRIVVNTMLARGEKAEPLDSQVSQ